MSPSHASSPSSPPSLPSIAASPAPHLRSPLHDTVVDTASTPPQAIGRLSEREAYDRAFRLRTASMCAIAHEELPKDQWIKPTEVRFFVLDAGAALDVGRGH